MNDMDLLTAKTEIGVVLEAVEVMIFVKLSIAVS